MFNHRHEPDRGAVFIEARHMQAAQAKWDRLTADDLAKITNQNQLVDRVSDRYSLPRAQAVADVRIWVSNARV